MVMTIEHDMLSGKEDPSHDVETHNWRSVAESGEDSNKGAAEDEPTRRSVRKRKLTTVKIGNYTVLAQDMGDSEESESSEVVVTKKPNKSKSAAKSPTAPKKSDKPPKKKTKKELTISTKARDDRCVSSVIPPEILERFFHESGNSSKTKEVTLKKQVLHGSTFDNTDNFCAKIVTPIVQRPQYNKYKLYFVLHFDGDQEMMYLTPLYRNGVVKTTGMNKYCVHVIPKTGPVTADTCWQAMNVIHVPCNEWRIVHSRAISKTPDVRCERWEILEHEFDRIHIPDYQKPKSLKGAAKGREEAHSSFKRSPRPLYTTSYLTSEDEDDENDGSIASSDTDHEHSVTKPYYHDVKQDTSITKAYSSDDSSAGDISIMEEKDNVDSETKYSHDLVKDEGKEEGSVDDNFDSQPDKKAPIGSSGDVIPSPPSMRNQLARSFDSVQCNSPSSQPTSSDRMLNNNEGEKVKGDMKSPDGVAMSQGQSRKLSEDSRVCESPVAQERLGRLENKDNEDKCVDEDIMLKDISFDRGFQALIAFQKTYDHVSVPWNYSEIPWLSAWCKKKREEYKEYQNNDSEDNGAITENQIHKLKSIGFDFHDSANQSFDEKLNELKEFKRIYGHDWFEHWRDKMRADAKKRKGSNISSAARKKSMSNQNKHVRNPPMQPPKPIDAFIHAASGLTPFGSQPAPMLYSAPTENALTEASIKNHIEQTPPEPHGAPKNVGEEIIMTNNIKRLESVLQMTQNSTSASSMKNSINDAGFVPPAAQNATVKSSVNYCIKRTIPIPLGVVGIHVAVNTEKQLYISRILPECPIPDEVKERDIITHLNGEDTKGDPVLFSNMLLNTMEGTRSITILRNVNLTYLSKDMFAKSSNSDKSSVVEGTEAIAKDDNLKKECEKMAESEYKDLKSSAIYSSSLNGMGTRE